MFCAQLRTCRPLSENHRVHLDAGKHTYRQWQRLSRSNVQVLEKLLHQGCLLLVHLRLLLLPSPTLAPSATPPSSPTRPPPEGNVARTLSMPACLAAPTPWRGSSLSSPLPFPMTPSRKALLRRASRAPGALPSSSAVDKAEAMPMCENRSDCCTLPPRAGRSPRQAVAPGGCCAGPRAPSRERLKAHCRSDALEKRPRSPGTCQQNVSALRTTAMPWLHPTYRCGEQRGARCAARRLCCEHRAVQARLLLHRARHILGLVGGECGLLSG